MYKENLIDKEDYSSDKASSHKDEEDSSSNSDQDKEEVQVGEMFSDWVCLEEDPVCNESDPEFT